MSAVTHWITIATSIDAREDEIFFKINNFFKNMA